MYIFSDNPKLGEKKSAYFSIKPLNQGGNAVSVSDRALLGYSSIFCTATLNTWGSYHWRFNIAYNITLVWLAQWYIPYIYNLWAISLKCISIIQVCYYDHTKRKITKFRSHCCWVSLMAHIKLCCQFPKCALNTHLSLTEQTLLFFMACKNIALALMSIQRGSCIGGILK